ncbi:dUTP diphosphatase [Candidatus Nomurabacteria bacterium]|uniref:dUTP diphosphatase n=1 Tax=candidate division WWE3 bacterium TaxID=2053526 RepID=A0A955E232_UNCKA|nr:dUTP diphosphatase [candidate division WWE3 bacterium]MCB9823956.1 dUTP diphosphatase [Candidatus Nomurabacteria bacterium]MCB9827063.1 dUTP diphosphatase [Candidatus Nomurabacteria bacterium]MCB9827895.1 dUTP diphosphatase [Candidatus Nomurabacteria bacterium]
MSKSLKDIEKDVIRVCNERNWNNTDPNQLISSIMIELAELAEHYQWQNDFSKIDKLSKSDKEELGYEFVDVLFYLLRLAHKSNIDIEKYFYKKLPKIKTKKYDKTYKP